MNNHVFANQMEKYYNTLGLDETASLNAIKQAYRQLARRYHPDLNPHNKMAEVKFKEINTAYQILSELKNNQQNNSSKISSKRVDRETVKTKGSVDNANVYNIFMFALQGKAYHF